MSKLFWEDENRPNHMWAGWEGFEVALNSQLAKMNPAKKKRAIQKIQSLKKQLDLLQTHANFLIEEGEYLDSKEVDNFINHEEEIIAKMGLVVGIKGIEINQDDRRDHYKRVIANHKESDELYDRFINDLNLRAHLLVLNNLEKSDEQLREDIEIDLSLYVAEFNNKYEYDIPFGEFGTPEIYEMYQAVIDKVRSDVDKEFKEHLNEE